jgi:tetratricopeptide (TPR) repeat protein
MQRLLLIVGLMVAGCANPLNLETGRQYFAGGQELARQGNWADARIAFGRAAANASMGGANDKILAACYYEYGRAAGAVCDWEESNKGLQHALALDTKIGGPVHMSLVELARMEHAKGDLNASAKYFARGIEALNGVAADKRDPLGYARVMKEAAAVYSQLGQSATAAQFQTRHDEIVRAFPGKSPDHDQTPYGKYCDQKPSSR